MMKFLKDYPLKRKLTLVILLTSGITLIVACTSFLIHDLNMLKKSMVTELAIMARMIGATSSAALVFEDREAAIETLRVLTAEPQIISTTLFTSDGRVLAEFIRTGEEKEQPALDAEGYVFTSESLRLYHSIIFDGERIGAVYMVYDLQPLRVRLWLYIAIAGGIFLVSTLVALVLSARLQRVISAPILELARTAKTVSREKNYDLRARKYNQDELGELIDRFNEMLAEIQLRDAKLASHQEHLEDLVTQRTVELEKAVVELHGEIEKREQVEKTLFRAQKMEAIGTLAGGIAHDFNNLLQAILGYANMSLLKLQKHDPAYRGVREIGRAAEKASELTQQLLTFSRKVESKLRPMDLNEEVRETVRLLARTIPKMIEIRTELTPDLGIIKGDPVQMSQVLMNLGLNARDAMVEGGVLTITTKRVTADERFCSQHLGCKLGPYAELSFRDTGHGMDKQTQEHIFEPFYSTKGVGKGTGLGLAMVYGIVKNHGGLISCSSEPGQGTTFSLYFPIDEEGEEVGEEELVRKELEGGSETILLVDDEEFIRDLGAEILAEFGYQVLAAADGETALEIYQSQGAAIDLVILDVIMPGMGGKRCLEKLLALNPQVKVIIASGFFADGKTKETLESGARGFISKPYDIAGMLKIIRDTLDDSESEREV